MLVLIAEDDPVSRRVLEEMVTGWGHRVVIARDGRAAWDLLRGPEAPQIAVLDWQMPHRNGPDICRLVDEERLQPRPYLILLSARDATADLVAGLSSGADDYVTKPFHADELRARLNAGVRILQLQRGLADRVRQLEEALAQIKQLQGLLPLCMYCKKIRDDQNYWQQLDAYLSSHNAAQFSHGICPECYERIVKPQLDEMSGKKGADDEYAI
jgi:sigma-B regulation protein RsbU (phosphoserine phosphatase)